jgi:hypothetical protein
MNRRPFNAYWIAPTGRLCGVPSTHIEYLAAHAADFGFTQAQLQEWFARYNEPVGFEGYARSEIMAQALRRGWIRLRYVVRSDSWTVQVDCCRTAVRQRIKRISKMAVRLGTPYAEFVAKDIDGEVYICLPGT